MQSDLLDYQRSEFKRGPTGTIYDIAKYVFEPQKLDGLSIFNLPTILGPKLVVSDQADLSHDFLAGYKASGFSGLDFDSLAIKPIDAPQGADNYGGVPPAVILAGDV